MEEVVTPLSLGSGKYEEKVKIGPNQSLLFGVVGQSPFGKGGEMQWHYSEKDHPPYRLLEQITWD